MASPLEIIMSLLQAPRPRQPVQMRPLEQILAGAQISPQRSQYERTMIPGEQRTAGDLQSMLGEVILAAGAGASPLVGPRGVELARAARPRPSSAPIEPARPQPEAWSPRTETVSHQPGEYVAVSGNQMHQGQVRMLERGNGFVVDKVDGGFKIVDPANGRMWKYPSLTQAIADFGFGQ